MIQLANQQNFVCDHLTFCHPFCHKRITRSCNRIVETLYKVLKQYNKVLLVLDYGYSISIPIFMAKLLLKSVSFECNQNSSAGKELTNSRSGAIVVSCFSFAATRIEEM